MRLLSFTSAALEDDHGISNESTGCPIKILGEREHVSKANNSRKSLLMLHIISAQLADSFSVELNM